MLHLVKEAAATIVGKNSMIARKDRMIELARSYALVTESTVKKLTISNRGYYDVIEKHRATIKNNESEIKRLTDRVALTEASLEHVRNLKDETKSCLDKSQNR